MTITAKPKWEQFLKALQHFDEMAIVGPFANPRKDWPVPAIFVDSASRFQGDDPLHVSVGDGDSSLNELDVMLPPEKDFSDLAYVLSQIPAHIRRLSMVGFLGGRRDHELLNLGEIHRFLQKRSAPVECDLDWAVCAFSEGQWPLLLKGLFSLIVFAPTEVQLTGACRYPIAQPKTLEIVSSFGLSNEGFGEVELRCRGPVFVFKNPLT